jgi:hypothetical protein
LEFGWDILHNKLRRGSAFLIFPLHLVEKSRFGRIKPSKSKDFCLDLFGTIRALFETADLSAALAGARLTWASSAARRRCGSSRR